MLSHPESLPRCGGRQPPGNIPATRSHLGIENSCHWCLDVTYREDESRIRDKHHRENFAWLRRFTLSLLKQHPSRDSIAMKRLACGWSDGFMLEVITGQQLS